MPSLTAFQSYQNNLFKETSLKNEYLIVCKFTFIYTYIQIYHIGGKDNPTMNSNVR